MAKRIVEFRECQADILKAFEEKRVLLVGQGKSGHANVMTIGWGAWGIIWRRPVFIVTIRPSRHTSPMIVETGEFSVNVLPPGREEVATYCGSVSGRDVNKFEAQHLTTIPASRIKTPIIKECIIHVECRIIGTNALQPDALDGAVRSEIYGNSTDFHRVHFGEIVACQRDTQP